MTTGRGTNIASDLQFRRASSAHLFFFPVGRAGEALDIFITHPVAAEINCLISRPKSGPFQSSFQTTLNIH